MYYGAVLKNAAQKYNIPISKRPPKIGGFVGKEADWEGFGGVVAAQIIKPRRQTSR